MGKMFTIYYNLTDIPRYSRYLYFTSEKLKRLIIIIINL